MRWSSGGPIVLVAGHAASAPAGGPCGGGRGGAVVLGDDVDGGGLGSGEKAPGAPLGAVRGAGAPAARVVGVVAAAPDLALDGVAVVDIEGAFAGGAEEAGLRRGGHSMGSLARGRCGTMHKVGA